MTGITAARCEPEAGTRRDRGLTLAELLVTMLLLAVVLALVGGFFVSVTSSLAIASSVDSKTRDASTSLEQMTRVIRVATNNAVSGSTVPESAIRSAARGSLTLYSSVDIDPAEDVAIRPPRPTMVRFEISPQGELEERRWLPKASGQFWVFEAASASTATTVRTFPGRIVDPSGAAPLFIYLDKDGLQLDPRGGVLTAAEATRVTSIQVVLRITDSSAGASQPVVVKNTILLTNVR